MIRSLRTKLLLGTSVTLVAVMSVLALAIDQSARLTLRQQFDAGLLSNANAISAMVKGKKDEVKLDSMALAIPEFLPDQDAAYFELWVGNDVIGRSPSLDAHTTLASPAPNQVAEGTYRVDDMFLPDGRPGRLLTMSFVPVRDPGGTDKDAKTKATAVATVKVAHDTLELNQTLVSLRWLTAGLFTAATLISGLVLLLLVNRTTRPMRRLADDIGRLKATDLTGTVAARGLPAELLPVVDRLNALLARLGEAFTLERAFTANVAHELRTPLAGILATLEVARSRPRATAELASAIDDSLLMLGQMQSLVENLLLLARAEGGQLTLRTAEADLAPLTRECWKLFDSRARQRGLHIILNLPDQCPVVGDPALLRIVLNNLLDNAVGYANDGGRITISLVTTAAAVGVCVANTGSELTAEDVGHVFERFWRKESARSETGLHAGLGLSLCQRLMALQGGRMLVETSGDEFRASALFELHKSSAPVPAENNAPACPPAPLVLTP